LLQSGLFLNHSFIVGDTMQQQTEAAMQHQPVTLHHAKQLITIIAIAEREEDKRSPSTLQGHMAPSKDQQ
jgi:hypothetical protein